LKKVEIFGWIRGFKDDNSESSVQFQRLNKKRLLKQKRKKETFEYRKEVYVYQPITGATGNV